MTFDTVVEELKSGNRVTRKQWGAATWLAVSGDMLVQSANEQEPYEYQLSWYEIEANDWEIAA